MTAARIFGEPHSLQRYLVFGIIAGIVAGPAAAAFHFSLPIVAAIAGGVAAFGAGKGPRVATAH